MKKKKQMKIILAIVAVIAVVLGGWVTMKPIELRAETYDEENRLNENTDFATNIAGDPFSLEPLSLYTAKWNDSFTSMIDENSSFSLLHSEHTQIICPEEGGFSEPILSIPEIALPREENFSDPIEYRKAVKNFSDKVLLRINMKETDENRNPDSEIGGFGKGQRFFAYLTNVGFYNGELVTVKVTITPKIWLTTYWTPHVENGFIDWPKLPSDYNPEDPLPEDTERLYARTPGLTVGKNQFMRIDYEGPKTGPSGKVQVYETEEGKELASAFDISYEFYKNFADGKIPKEPKKIEISSSYLHFSNVNTAKLIAIDSSEIGKLYSIPRVIPVAYLPSYLQNPTTPELKDYKFALENGLGRLAVGYSTNNNEGKTIIGGIEGAFPGRFTRIQQQFSMSFINNSGAPFSWSISARPGSNVPQIETTIIPNGETQVKIKIPNPQIPNNAANGREVKEITKNNSQKIPYSFVQQIPFEMKHDATPENKLQNPATDDFTVAINNRNQAMKWEVSPVFGDEGATVIPTAGEANSPWLVENEDGEEANSYFERKIDKQINAAVYTPTTQDAEPETIDGVDNAPQADGFYNHYYTFTDYMKMDYEHPINEGQLKAFPGSNSSIKNYLDLTSTVDFEVKGPNGQQYGNATDDKEFHTWINFEADVDYEIYLLGEDNDPETVTTPQKTIKGNAKVPPTTPENEDEPADDEYVLWGDSYIPKLVTKSLDLTNAEKTKITAYAKSNGYVFSPNDTKYVVGGNFDQTLNPGVTNQIGYTNGNVVKLYFKRAPFLTVNELNFEQTKLPLSKDPGTYIKRDESFNLSVSDPNQTNLEWSVAVQLKTPFYKADDNEDKTPVPELENSLRVVSNKVVYQEIPTNTSITLATDLTENIGPYNFTEKWKPNTGILLYLTKENSQKLAAEIKDSNKTEESYQAELEFTVTIAEPEGGD